MVPPSSDYRYPQAWDCVSPSNGRFFQDRDHLPITLHTPGVTQVPGSFLPPMASPTLLPHRPLRLGVEDGRQRPSNSCLTLGCGPADPSQESEIRKAVCFSFQEEQASRAFPNNHEPDPSEDQQGLSSSDQLPGQPWSGEQAWGPGPCSSGSSQARGQAGLKARLAGARVGTCLGEPQGRACLTPGRVSQASSGPSGARASACVWRGWGGGESLPGHVGGWEPRGCDLAPPASLWLPCGHFHF